MLIGTNSSSLAAPIRLEDPVMTWRPPEFLQELVEDNVELLAELLAAFTSDTGSRVRQLPLALSRQDIPELCSIAHTAKGAASQLGAVTVAAICEKIEHEAPKTPLPLLRERISSVETAFEETCKAMNVYLQGQQAGSIEVRSGH